MQHGKHSKRYPTGSLAALIWRQFKAYLRSDQRFATRETVDAKTMRQRVTDSPEPARAHAELVESDKQNRYAAELWKHHAEEAQKSLLLHAMVLELLADKLISAGLGDLSDDELAGILRDAAATMRNARR